MMKFYTFLTQLFVSLHVFWSNQSKFVYTDPIIYNTYRKLVSTTKVKLTNSRSILYFFFLILKYSFLRHFLSLFLILTILFISFFFLILTIRVSFTFLIMFLVSFTFSNTNNTNIYLILTVFLFTLLYSSILQF